MEISTASASPTFNVIFSRPIGGIRISGTEVQLFQQVVDSIL
jgi:hypothetical protein